VQASAVTDYGVVLPNERELQQNSELDFTATRLQPDTLRMHDNADGLALATMKRGKERAAALGLLAAGMRTFSDAPRTSGSERLRTLTRVNFIVRSWPKAE